MRLLLDTHALLWFFAGNERMSLYAREAVANPDNELWLSVVSLWEITIKINIGKLVLEQPFETAIVE